MVMLYIIYAVLIVGALAIIPFRVKARRQTLREIDALRSTFHSNVEGLLARVETTMKPKPDVHALLLDDKTFHAFSWDQRESELSKAAWNNWPIVIGWYVDIEQHILVKPHHPYLYWVSDVPAWASLSESEYEERDIWATVGISNKTPQRLGPYEDALAPA